MFDFERTPITKRTKLKAVYDCTPVSYTVTFDTAGGSAAPEPQQVVAGELAIRPQDPTREDYDFEGWYLDGQLYNFDAPVQSDLHLVAKWEAIVYRIVTVDSGIAGSTPYTIRVRDGAALEALAPPSNPNPDCTWINWYRGDTVYDFSQLVTEDFTLVGYWQCKLTVTFKPNREGLETFTRKVDIGQTVARPDDPIDLFGGSTFKGWKEEN